MPLVEQEVKKNPKNLKGPCVKQFEWFQMQTRLRKIIQQIVDPVQAQIIKNGSQINKLQQNDQTFHEKIQYILKMTTNDPDIFQKGVFKKIEDKFETQQKTLTFLQEQVKNNTLFVNNKINLIDERMKESNDMITQIEQLKMSNRQNLKIQTQKFQTVRKNIQENVQKMSLAIQENQKNSRQKIQKLQKEISFNVMKMENLQKQFKVVKELFNNQKTINDNLISEGIKLSQDNKGVQNKLNQINKKIKDLSKIKPFLSDVQIEYRKLLFKVDNIIPLINEAQINESLYKILPDKFHPRIAVYEFQRYIQLNDKVLYRHFEQDPTSINFNGEQLIRQSQQRNTKLLTKLKRSYYKNNGVDLDFISYEERQRLLNEFDYPRLCEIVDQLQEIENQKNDRKKHHKLTEEDIIRIINKQIQNDKALLIEKIQTQLKDSKTYLESNAQEMNKYYEYLDEKIQNVSKNFEYYKNFQEISAQNLDKNVKQIQENVHKIISKIKIVSNFNLAINSYLQKNLIVVKKVKQIEKKIQKFDHLHSLSVHNKLNDNKHNNRDKDRVLPNQSNKKRPDIGVMIMSDQDDMSNSKPIHQKQNNHENQDHNKNLLQEEESIVENIKRILDEFKEVGQQTKKTNSKFRSSFSKITRPSQSEIKFRSQSSFDFNRKQKSLNLQICNKSIHLTKNPQSSQKGLLNIPSFKHDTSTKYCRQSYTSRLSMRKKPSLAPSKAHFFNINQKTQNIKNNEVRNSLSYFSELKKQNSRYLK